MKRKLYTFKGGTITKGIVLDSGTTKGEEGVQLGWRFHPRGSCRISIERNNAPEIVDKTVLEAEVKTIKPRGKKHDFRPFVVLSKGASTEATDQAVYLRINTGNRVKESDSYFGSWKPAMSNPKEIACGFGGKGNGWSDSLVEFHPNQVIRVNTVLDGKKHSYAIWMEDGEPQCTRWATWMVQSVKRRSTEALRDQIGAISWFTLMPESLEPQTGIELKSTRAGSAIVLGEPGLPEEEQGNFDYVIPHLSAGNKSLTSSGAGKVARTWFTQDNELPAEPQRIGLRIKLAVDGKSQRGAYRVKGAPILIGAGRFATVNQPVLSTATDTLWVIGHDEAVLFERHESDPWVASNANGELLIQPYLVWKEQEVNSAPEAYLEEGIALAQNVPASWIGKAVSAMSCTWNRSDNCIDLEGEWKGTVVSVNPLVVDVSWVPGEHDEQIIDIPAMVELVEDTDALIEELLIEAYQEQPLEDAA